jgi:RNA polymerase sigma-70 factor (ECF subfamily)
VGADKVARFFLSIWTMPYREWVGVVEGPDLELQVVQVNDGPAILGTAGERPIGVLTLDVADEVIQAIEFVANPDKLSGLRR